MNRPNAKTIAMPEVRQPRPSTPPVHITVIGTTNDETVGKRYWMEEGQLYKSSSGASKLTKGYARRETLEPASPHASIIALRKSLTPSELMVGGVFDAALGDTVELRTKGFEAGGISRTKECLPWAEGAPGVMTLDCDAGGDDSTPDIKLTAPQDSDALLAQLESVAPGLTAAYALEPSSSAGLAITGGEQIKPSNSWHFHRAVVDAADIPRAIEALHKRLVIAGHGWSKISGAPATLPRSAVDMAMRTPNQPIYVTPQLGEGLERRCEAPRVVEGGLYDTRRNIPNLSAEEEAAYRARVAAADKDMKSKHSEVYAQIRERQERRIAEQRGCTMGEAKEQLDKNLSERAGLWAGTQTLRLHKDGDEREVTVNDILASPANYNGCTCADPLEPDYGGGVGTAIIYTDHNPTPLVHSMAHGAARRYLLRMDAKGMFKHLKSMKKKQRANLWAATVAELLMDCDEERAKLIPKLEKLLDEGPQQIKRQLSAAIKKSREWLEHELRTGEFKQGEAKARAEGRLPLEYNPLAVNRAIHELHRHLGDATHHDPVLQIAGRLIVVREGPPAYVTAAQGKTGVPVEPILKLTPLKREGMRQLIEERSLIYTMKDEKVNGQPKATAVPIPVPPMLPSEVLNAHTLNVQHVSGIVEHPLVRPDGTILSESGYDPATGLFVRNTVDGCIPTDLSQEAAGRALVWLREVLFAEFPFATDLDEDVAVAILLTAMQRAVLDKSPGAMIDANTQSVGKTQLAQAIQQGLTGRGTPAISLPESEEETEKRLMAVVLEGRSFVLFDNVRQGRALKSECISAAITAPEGFMGRILGESRTATAPARVMLVLSGVNIAPTGDFASRFLTVRLHVEGEQAMFTKYSRDLDKWVPAHRAEIIKACLTIIAGYLASGDKARPTIEATRFSRWDELVRKPLWWAAKGSGFEAVDVAEAFERNIAEDPEAENITDLLGTMCELGPLVSDGGWWTAGELLPDNWESDFTDGRCGNEVHALRTRLVEILVEMHPKTKPTSGNLARQVLTPFKGRAAGGFSLVRGAKTKRGRVWRVNKIPVKHT